MSLVSIIGAGEIGSATAYALARRSRVGEVRLVDSAASVAAGKALDMRQSGPIDHFDTPITARGDVLDAVGADVIVIADAHETGEWDGDRGLALIAALVRAGATAPIVCAGPGQTRLMEMAVAEAGIDANRIVGSAGTAMHSGIRALIALEVNGSAADVSVAVVGRAPGVTIGWTSATVAGSTLTSAMPPHRMLAVSDLVKKMWPPRPQTVGAATAVVVEALLSHSRRHVYATTVLDGADGHYADRGIATLLPLELGEKTVLRRIEPSLSTQERVEFLNGLAARRG